MGRPRTEAPSPYTPGHPPPEALPRPESNPRYPPPNPPAYSIQQVDPAPKPSHFQQPVTAYPPVNAAYPPSQAAAYPPLGQQRLDTLASAAPQPAKFPPETYIAPPTFHQNPSVAAAAPGIPVRQQQYASAGMPGGIRPPGTVLWTTGLFNCGNDPTNAIMTLFCPCVTFGQIAEIVDEGRSACSTSGMIYGCVAALIALPCLISCGYRTRLRAKYDLVESPAPDWVTHFLCEFCALCQEYRELRNRGLDPAIGWHANMAKIQSVQQGVAMAPPLHQIMTG